MSRQLIKLHVFQHPGMGTGGLDTFCVTGACNGLMHSDEQCLKMQLLSKRMANAGE